MDELWKQAFDSSEKGEKVSHRFAALLFAEAAAPTVQEPQRYSPDGEGGMELDSLGAYVKLQDVTTPPAAQPAPVQEPSFWVVRHKDQKLVDVFCEKEKADEWVLQFRKGWAWVEPLYTTQPAAQPAPVSLPFGVGGGLVAIKTLLSRDPCVHANTAIEMIDAILKEHPAAPVQELVRPTKDVEISNMGRPFTVKAYTTPPAAQPAVPEGWKLVPIEPTDEMIDDGLSKVDDLPDFYRVDAVAVYQAMLAAAPEKGQP
jgi:hypothetical protein